MTANEMKSALGRALLNARKEYRKAVIELATSEAAKGAADGDDLADVDHLHSARTRIIALEAASQELTEAIEAGDMVTEQ